MRRKMVNCLAVVAVLCIVSLFSLGKAAEASELKLTYPNGGETWFAGGTVTITWEGYLDKEFHAFLSVDSGETYLLSLGSGMGGSMDVVVPNTPTANARIKLKGVTDVTMPTPGLLRIIYSESVSETDFSIVTLTTIPVFPIMLLPTPPSDLEAAFQEPQTIALTWTDAATSETGYTVERKAETSTNWNEIAQLPANSTTYQDQSELVPEMNYYYRVKAFNSYGDSIYSNTAVASIPLLQIAPPEAPTGLTAQLVGDEVRLTWVDHADDELGFAIERDAIQIATVAAGITTFIDGAPPEGESITYRVRAFNDGGYSAYSNSASVTLPQETITIKLQIGSLQYSVNGVSMTMDAAPIVKEGRTLLPIRFIAEPLGASVGWSTAEQKASVELADKTIALWIGKNQARVNGVYEYIDAANQNVVPIVVPPGRTMLPLRYVAEALGCQVDWNPITQEITISKGLQ